MVKKKHSVSKEDAALFRSKVADATPLKSDRVVHKTPATIDKTGKNKTNQYGNPFREEADEQYSDNQPLDDFFENGSIDANTVLFFQHPGLQHREIKRLKRGEFDIEGRLDLHGLNSMQAKQKLLRFVNNGQRARKRCLLIIHGRGLSSDSGKAILKTALHHWLPQIPAIMAFSSALPRDGGLGAVYVLLRRGEVKG
ncbi:MAG: Smr/MutS family protein [Thiohalomonadales bacterium]